MTNNYTNLTDEELAVMVQQGDGEAFGVLATQYRQKLIRYGNKLLFNNSEVEDVVQEILLKSYRYIKSFDAKQKFSPWIYRIAHNEFINLGKKRGRELLNFFDPETFFPHLSSVPAEQNQSNERVKEMLGGCLDNLDAKYKEPLVLYFLENFSYKEIGKILNIPIGTVSIRISRGLVKLKLLCK